MGKFKEKAIDEINKNNKRDYVAEFYNNVVDISMDDKFRILYALLQEINMADNEVFLMAGSNIYKNYMPSIEGMAGSIRVKVDNACREEDQ